MTAADETETNATGGKQSRLTGRSDLLPPAAVLAVADVLKRGSEKYGDRNWRLIPTREHLNHAITHLFKFLSGDQAEAHLHNAACRALMALEIDLVGMDKPGPVAHSHPLTPEGEWRQAEGVAELTCGTCGETVPCRMSRRKAGQPTVWRCAPCAEGCEFVA